MQNSLVAINERISDKIKNNELNFCELFRPDHGNQVSVTGRYNPVLGKEYIRLNPTDLRPIIVPKNNHNDYYKDYYYGASPKIDGTLIINCIANLSLTNENQILNFLMNHSNDFALHVGDERYLLSISKYILLSICGNFGITLKFANKEDVEVFMNKLPKYKHVFLPKEDELSICGCPTEELLRVLSNYRYYKNNVGETYIDNYSRWNVDSTNSAKNRKIFSISEVYSDPKSIHIIKGNEFYSGVVFRPLKISEELHSNCNKNAVPVVIDFERSTYGTVYSFDNNLMDHPLLNDCDKNLISEFFAIDDDKKRTLAESLRILSTSENYNAELLKAINIYLATSNNVNQICIAGSLVSKDDYLFCCQRSAKAIDSNQLYPSVNGNAELIDSQVEYYKKSVNVDFPSVDLNGIRLDFNGELTREAKAELGLDLPNEGWICYGIALLGMTPNGEATSNIPYPYKKRRMHLSIIMHQQCAENLNTIRDKQKKSTESHETRSLYGIKFVQHQKVSSYLGMHIKMIINAIAKMKNAILSLFTILLFLLAMDSYFESSDSLLSWVTQWNKFLSLLFALAIVIMTICDIISQIKKMIKTKRMCKTIRVLSHYQNKRQKNLLNKLEKTLEKGKVYPITFLLFYCYIYDITNTKL